MGIGFALTEEVLIGDEGQVLNPDFADYKVPTALDVPDTQSVIIEEPCAYGPHGAKGLGEPTMGPPAAAIGNAIYDAVGVRMRSTPMTPEKIKVELDESGEKKLGSKLE
jgi:CO/xanthine dehydrogenase Mo-binding subunit